MKQMALIMFILGCAAGGVSSNLVGKAGASAPPNVTRWEYRCVPGLHWNQMNEVGAVGWELVTYAPGGDGSDACFKRPLP